MKYFILIIVIVAYSCSNNSNQVSLYQDSARMFMDSIEKYKPIPITNTSENSAEDIYKETYRKQMYQMYVTMREYYLEKANSLK